MKRFIIIIVAMTVVHLSWAQISVGTRDNQYIYGEYQYNNWNLKLEESVYAEKIGFQYLRLYTGYQLKLHQSTLSVYPYFGTTYNGNYYSTGCFIDGKYHFLDKFNFFASINPHYDSGYKYKTCYRIGVGMNLTSQIGIKAEFQDMPIYRMKEKRLKGGIFFKTGNLMVIPQLSIPSEGVINNIRCIVDFKYIFLK